MLNIAGLPVLWQSTEVDFVKDFIIDNENEPAIKIKFKENLISSYSVQYTDRNFTRFLRSSVGEVLFSDDKWTDVTIYGTNKNSEHTLPLAALCSRFSFFDTILVHASVIDFDGNGVLFIGPSGIGKTTQAQLWNKYKGADVINGDKAFLRVINGSALAFGLPWKGSSTYCINRNVPIKAIVMLAQSDENVIKKLDEESLELFMPHVFFPHWDKVCLENSLDTVTKVIKSVAFYSLECRPDEDSVKLLFNTVFG